MVGTSNRLVLEMASDQNLGLYGGGAHDLPGLRGILTPKKVQKTGCTKKMPNSFKPNKNGRMNMIEPSQMGFSHHEICISPCNLGVTRQHLGDFGFEPSEIGSGFNDHKK